MEALLLVRQKTGLIDIFNTIYLFPVKYSEPKHLIKFPVKLEEATEEEKKRIQLLRRPKQKLVVTEDTGSGFDPRKYIKF